MQEDAKVLLEKVLNAKDTLKAQQPVEEVKDKESIDPVEASAYFIHLAHQDFKRLAYGLANTKKRALARVLEAVLFEPLEKIELFGKVEEDLFALCQEILYNKGNVLQYAFKRIDKKQGEMNESEQN